ncbi:MAG: ComEC/Rec2 family competence protein [Chthoniobacterales bacterium]|nr:ComEC/Rec2 family competence protein [Chthoniobacterales bacterium]
MNQGCYELPTTNHELSSNRRLKGKRFPFVGLVLAAMVGILSEELLQYPSWWLMLGLMAAFGGWLMVRRWRLPFCFLLVALFLGLIHAWQWEEAPARRIASLINNSNSTVLVKGVVTSEVKRVGKNHVTFLMEVQQLEWNFTTLTPSVTMFVHWEGAMPAYGDLVSLRAAAESSPLPKNPGEFNKAAWLARQEVCTELKMDPSEPGVIVSSGHGFFLKRWAISWRERAEKVLELGLEGETSVVSIIKGIVLGIKENEASIDDFKLTGTMHLFAVSGLHVGMIVMMIWFFLKLLRFSSRVAVPVTLLFLFAYVMMTGCHIGSLRAAVMASIVLIGFLLERRPQILNNLAAAAFLLLLFNTNLLFSMGWQFSFSVVLAIVVLAPLSERSFKKYFEYDSFLPKSLITLWQKRWQHVGKHVAQLIGVSIAAWVGALLPTAYYFHQISFSALGANVLAVPLTFLIMLTALLAIGTGLITSSGAIIFNNANWLFVKMLICVIHGFALLPWSSYSIALPSPSHPRLTLFAFPDAQVALLQTEGKNWLINTGRAANATKTIFPFLETSGIKRLDGILLTNEEPAFAGGASLLINQFSKAILLAPSEHGHSYLFQRLIKAYRATHDNVISLQQRNRIDFSSACWGEVFEPPNSVSLALKLHLGTTTVLMIPDAAAGQWLLTDVGPEMLHADVLNLPWKNCELLQQKPLLTTIRPRMLVLPDHFPGQQKVFRDKEKQLLQQHGITLFSQEEAGAIIIDVLSQKIGVRLQISNFNKRSELYF